MNLISKKKKSQEVLVKVKDNGQGIHPDIMPKLFTKFASKGQSGTGLGCTYQKQSLKLMVVEFEQKIIVKVKVQILLKYPYPQC